MKKIWTIIKSRFTKPKENKEIKRRREICLGCEYNSNNISKLSTYKSFLASLSAFYTYIKTKDSVELKKAVSKLYSKITGKEEEDSLNECNYCGCSIYYKTIYETVCPHPKGDKWKNQKLKLSDRKWVCSSCDIEHDRDINASKNILKEGLMNISAGIVEYTEGDSNKTSS